MSRSRFSGPNTYNPNLASRSRQERYNDNDDDYYYHRNDDNGYRNKSNGDRPYSRHDNYDDYSDEDGYYQRDDSRGRDNGYRRERNTPVYGSKQQSRKQTVNEMKNALGLSDEEVEKDSDDDATTPSANSKTASEIKRLKELYNEAKNQLKISKEKEEKAQSSLNQLELISKSQTAILKTSFSKKMKTKEILITQMREELQRLEAKMKQSGVDFDSNLHHFDEPLSKESSSETSAVEEEFTALRNEVLRLKKEISSLDNSKSSNNSKVVGEDETIIDDAKQNAKRDKGYKKKITSLEAEKAKLMQLLKEAQVQMNQWKENNENQEKSSSKSSVDNSNKIEQLKETEKSLKKYQLKVKKLEEEVLDLKKSNSKKLLNSKDTDQSSDEQDTVRELQSKLDEKIAEVEHIKEDSKQKCNKIKETAQSELIKIKDQAKKAITDLKHQLSISKQDSSSVRKFYVGAKKDLSRQRDDLQALRSGIKNQLEQLPKFSDGIALKITQRLKKEKEAMSSVIENYKKEVVERKRLFNLVQQLRGNIRVLCRVRPISKSEIAKGTKDICKFNGNQEIVLTNERGKVKNWEFDKVFGPDSKQSQLFAEVKPLVTSILDGYNVCIFAYGQTGTGKTFTMTGIKDNPGINTQSLHELFSRKSERCKEYGDEITVSMIEIYNEQIRDLLGNDVKNSNLSVRQGPNGNYVPNLTLVPVQSMDDVSKLIELGDKNRATSSTDMNEHSSRSHSILSIYIKSTNYVTKSISNGKLHLVDLAGSERISKTGASGQRLKEAQNINKSLSSLGDVISARANKAKHVPYRNSQLTFLLQDSLGGDSKTLMVACASPVDYNVEESFCTLNFAARARSVEMGKATKNVQK